MQVLLEPIEKGFRVTTGKPLDIVAEGETAEKALDTLKIMVAQRMESGAEIVEVNVPSVESPCEHPWAWFAGIWKDDPLFDDWQASIERYRNEREDDPDSL